MQKTDVTTQIHCTTKFVEDYTIHEFECEMDGEIVSSTKEVNVHNSILDKLMYFMILHSHNDT